MPAATLEPWDGRRVFGRSAARPTDSGERGVKVFGCSRGTRGKVLIEVPGIGSNPLAARGSETAVGEIKAELRLPHRPLPKQASTAA